MHVLLLPLTAAYSSRQKRILLIEKRDNPVGCRSSIKELGIGETFARSQRLGQKYNNTHGQAPLDNCRCPICWRRSLSTSLQRPQWIRLVPEGSRLHLVRSLQSRWPTNVERRLVDVPRGTRSLPVEASRRPCNAASQHFHVGLRLGGWGLKFGANLLTSAQNSHKSSTVFGKWKIIVNLFE